MRSTAAGRLRRTAPSAGAAAPVAILAVPAAARAEPPAYAGGRDPGRGVLAPGDGGNGTAPHGTGAAFNGFPADLLPLHDADASGSARPLVAGPGRTPALHGGAAGAPRAAQDAARGAGAGRIR
ncbi:hypothetical protein [Streptomyces sp. SP18CS02]|uniref:hypothetical protein n=1 Tax=Streptomyces sp. SP18CS02 TaxID=3002531 RepID=UPI002E77E5E5|nr:hypothetical protein [Streptomyces sp. SP18CS02]MEE1754869.1 hypothetical protein [Streptomyces sp. SP18CS02]